MTDTELLDMIDSLSEGEAEAFIFAVFEEGDTKARDMLISLAESRG